MPKAAPAGTVEVAGRRWGIGCSVEKRKSKGGTEEEELLVCKGVKSSFAGDM